MLTAERSERLEVDALLLEEGADFSLIGIELESTDEDLEVSLELGIHLRVGVREGESVGCFRCILSTIEVIAITVSAAAIAITAELV